MSSPLSDAFKNAVNKKVEEIEEKQKTRIEIAMEKTEKRVADKIQEFINRDGMDFYYNGYSPIMYKRTGNLRDSGAVSPCIEETKNSGYVGFRYGATFDETLMDHSGYWIHINYNHKRDGGSWSKDYWYEDADADEKKILDNFRAGVHPQTFVNQGPIWMSGLQGAVPDAIRTWKDSGAIKDIFMEEFQKLRK